MEFVTVDTSERVSPIPAHSVQVGQSAQVCAPRQRAGNARSLSLHSSLSPLSLCCSLGAFFGGRRTHTENLDRPQLTQVLA